MLYKQFKRVYELDSQIADYHNKLMQLYVERAQLVSDQNVPTEGFAHNNNPGAYVTTSLQGLTLTWERYGVKIPTSKSFVRKVENAIEIRTSLIAEEPGLYGKLHVVAVPPYKTIKKVLDTKKELTENLMVEFANQQLENSVKSSQSWKVVLVASNDIQVPVQNMQSWGENEFRFKDYSCEAMGVREYLASLLQDSSLIAEDTWTLLLGDAKQNATTIPCAIKRGQHVLFDEDDSRILLGKNFLQPTVGA